MNLETVEDDRGHPTQDEVCPVCGESNFYSEGGFYYCSLCNTQSQSARLYVDENFATEATTHTRAAVLRKEKQKKGRTDKNDTGYLLTSWEIFNVVLKYMADRLVEIGFPDTIRAKIFQLYVAFMMKRKVIFLSKINPDAKSTVTLGEPKTNLYALYGKYGIKPKPSRSAKKAANRNYRTKYKKKGEKRKASKKVEGSDEEIDDENDPTRFLSRAQKKHKITMNKRKAMEQEYLGNEADNLEVDTAFEDLLNKQLEAGAATAQSSRSKPCGRIFAYSRATTKLGKSGFLKVKTLKRNLLRIGGQRFRKQHIKIATSALRFERFTFKSCLILVFVALRQLGFPVLLSDILRLYFVGILSISATETAIFAQKIKGYENATLSNFFTRCKKYEFSKVADETYLFIEYLGVKRFHFPHVKEVVSKFMDEFVLPREFECLVNLINHAVPLDTMLYCNFDQALVNEGLVRRCRIVPEVLVMAQIIVVLKMLFGLDDRTERHQSRFAKLVNQVMKEEFKKVDEWTELFVIEDWFGYLLRRRELVKNELSNGGTFAPNSPASLIKLNQLMEEHCSISSTGIDDDDDTRRSSEEAAIAEAIKAAQEMFKNILKDSSPTIPALKPYIPLPLPTQSIVEQYLERYPLVCDPSFNPELLKTNFAPKRMDFLWNPKKYAKFLKLRGYKVKIIQGDAINNFPVEMEEEYAKSNVIVVFQPYKNFDDFVGSMRAESSSSIQLLLSLCEDIVVDENAENLKLKHRQTQLLMHRLVNSLGNGYIKKILAEQIPVLMRWDEPLSD